MRQISILGCGWLGLPLAEAFISEGWAVKGSTTSPDKFVVLHDSGIDPHVIYVNADSVDGDVKAFLEGSEILIVDIPPKLRAAQSESFIDRIKTLVPHIEAVGIGKLIFISSTSVYADDNSIVTEETPPNPVTESGRQLVEAEKLLQDNPHFQTTVVRFGGLLGYDRHPVKHLAGKENLENPDAPINLIHRDDCIGIIMKIIEKEVWGEIFNGVAPYHPSRSAYYTSEALKMGLAVPHFSKETVSAGKTITADKVINILHYKFKGF